MKFSTALHVVVAIGIAELAGIIGAFFTMDAIPTWYAEIVKPAWNPPAWVFGPVWVALYAMMGVAAWLVWVRMDSRPRKESRYFPRGELRGNDNSLDTGLRQYNNAVGARERRKIKGALAIFGVQLFLNAIWSIIFFGLKSPGWAFVEIVFLWIAIVGTIGVFWRISKPAAWLLVPYIAWVSFAGYLNYTIWDLNRGEVVREIYCTMEAKVCPDGSAVGRSGPKCEFAACPASAVDTREWKTATDEVRGISFKYPETLSTTYMRAYDWPPQVAVTEGPFACLEAGSEIERAGKTELRMVDDRPYCVTKVSEGAAGSIYTQYAYAVERGSKVFIYTATVRATQCGNYDEPYKTECEQERETFDFDSVMDSIIRSTVVQ